MKDSSFCFPFVYFIRHSASSFPETLSFRFHGGLMYLFMKQIDAQQNDRVVEGFASRQERGHTN